MEDRDGKKPFIIPKTHTSSKDVLISERPDSRNVTDLFNDIRSCALEAQFDFRQNGCKSCDTIRNQKLQKLYIEKRIKMKKDQDPIERLAFHLITYRGVAVNVANNGLSSEELTFPIDKYLGNPKDGVHLSRRPDVLLTSSGVQGLYRFGLLVCKVLLGKGYATLPSTTNNQLPAQVHYDHHFCKIQSINKAQHRADDLLANSLIFCYEHENFETISHPSQILPIAILWYDLTEKFSPDLMPVSTQESQHRNGKTTNGGKSIKKKTQSLISVTKPPIPNAGVWEGPAQESTTVDTSESSTTKYPSHFLVPYHRVYSTPSVVSSLSVEIAPPLPQQQANSTQQIINPRDPRLLRTKRDTVSTSSDTIPLSPRHLLKERSLSDGSIPTKLVKHPSDEPVLITKSTSMVYIPLNSSASLIDPRLKTLKQTRSIFYLEMQAVKHALQQQKRLNHYYDPKSGLPPKTSYTLLPFLMRHVSTDEYERLRNDNQNTYKFTKHSNGIDYSSLYVSVVDCFGFGLIRSTEPNQAYVDLEQSENKVAYEQIEISNELIQRESQLNSQQIRLRLREKRQRRIQQQINEKKIYEKPNFKSPFTSPSLSNSKLYVATGKQLLKEHRISTPTAKTHLSSDLLNFFSQEYKSENRPHVKHLLAELVGVFMEKYHIEHNQIGQQNGERNHSSIEEPVAGEQTMNSVIDMDLDSPSPQTLRDCDERFRIPTPPPLPPPLALPPLPSSSSETVHGRSHKSSLLTPTLTNQSESILNDPDYTVRCQKLVEQLREEYRLKQLSSTNSLSTAKSKSIISTDEAVFKACFEHSESSSSENSLTDDNHSLVVNEDLPAEEPLSLLTAQGDSNRSLDEFVKLLTKEAYVTKSSSPAKKQNPPKHTNNYSKHRRRSHDDNNRNNSFNRSNSSRRYPHSPNKKSQPKQSLQKNVSSNRTVLITQRSIISNGTQQTTDLPIDSQPNSQEEPKVKRLKVDSSVPSSPNTTDHLTNSNETHPQDSGVKSMVTVPVVTDDHDCRHDLNEKRRFGTSNTSVVSTADHSRTKSSRSRSRSKSKDHHSERRRSSTNSHKSSTNNSKTYSQSFSKTNRISSKNNQHRHQQQQQHPQNRDNHKHERKRSPNHHHKTYSNQPPDRQELFYESSMYHARDVNDLTQSGNLHHQRQQPVRHKRFNYNHQSVANHPRFANPDVLLPPAPMMDFDCSQSTSRQRSISAIPIEDRNLKSSYHHDPSESSARTYSNSFDFKQSNAIEQLQMFLQNKTNNSLTQSDKIIQ